MSLIEKSKGILHWNHLKLDDGLAKRGCLNSRETHIPLTSAGSQSRLGVDGRYFKAMAKFARLVDKDSNKKDRSVVDSCSGRDCCTKFSYGSLPIEASLRSCYLSPCATLEGAKWDVPANVSVALQQGKRVHVAKNITLGFSPSVCRIVPHSKSSTSTHDKPNGANIASSHCGSLRSLSALTGGVSKSASVSPCHGNAPHVSTIIAKKKFLGSFPESGNLLPVKWAQVLHTPATFHVASTLPTLTPNLIINRQTPSEAKSQARSNTGNLKLGNQHHLKEFQQGDNNSGMFVPPVQDHGFYSISLSRVQLPCVFRPVCLENNLASKIMYSDRQVECSYKSFPTSSPQDTPSPNERSSRAVPNGLQNKASDKLPGVTGSEDKKAPIVPEPTAGDNASVKVCIPQQPKQALPGEVSSERTGRIVAKHQQRRPGYLRRFTGVLKDKRRTWKGEDSVCLPLISNKTSLGNGSQFANRNNAALAYVAQPSPRAAKICVSARTDNTMLKNAGTNTKNTTPRITKEKLPAGCSKSRESCLKMEEKIGNSQVKHKIVNIIDIGNSHIKPKIADNIVDNGENEAKKCLLPQGVNITTGKCVTKLPGIKLMKKIGKTRPRSKRRSDARKPVDTGGQPRFFRKPQGGDLKEEKQALARFSKRLSCARLRKGVGSTKKILQPVANKPSASNSAASVITEEEEALLRAKWAELKFLNLPSPKKPKDEPPSNKSNDLKNKKTNRASRSGSVKKKSDKKNRRKNVIQKKKAKKI